MSSRGVPDADLIAETQSDNTDESTQRAAVIMRRNGLNSVPLVSDAYHLFRPKQMIIARDSPRISRPGQISTQNRVGQLPRRLPGGFQFCAVSVHVR